MMLETDGGRVESGGGWRDEFRGWRLVIFAAGLVVSIVMAVRSQVTIDQYNLLARGWRLAFEGELVPHGVWATGGGQHPGPATSLLVGLPLLVWHDHHAPVVLVLASHVVAYLLLAGTLRRILGPEEQLLFTILYWLSPWHLFFSGFLWNPNLLFLCGALHLTTAYQLRKRPRFWPSLGHVLIVGLAVQLHLSAALLAVATVALWARRYVRLHLAGVAAGGAVVLAMLVPWLLAVLDDPTRLPMSTTGLADKSYSLMPIVQGLMNWLRYAGIGLNRSMACLDFSGLGGLRFDDGSPVFTLLRSLVLPTVLVSLWANWRVWRRPAGPCDGSPGSEADRRWLNGVVRWSLVVVLALLAISPVEVTGHGLLSVFHLAVLPVVLALGPLMRAPWRRPLLGAAAGYAALALGLGVAMAFGSTAYRCGGPRCGTEHFARPSLLADHAMFDDLAIRATCDIVVDDPNGWWPDGLVPPPEVAARFSTRRIDLETRRPDTPNRKPGGSIP